MTYDELLTTHPLPLNIKNLIYNPLDFTQYSSAWSSQIDTMYTYIHIAMSLLIVMLQWTSIATPLSIVMSQ